MENAPPGSLGLSHPSGWMTAENFLKYLQHFKNDVRPSKDHPILLLMDNHAFHVTLDAVNFCRDNYITMLGFPAHTSNKLQPLDVSVYGPLKTAYSVACNDYMVSHPGETIDIQKIAGIFNTAYNKAATLQNAISGFRATGIEPFNRMIFNDDDFEPAQTTEQELDESEFCQPLPPETVDETSPPPSVLPFSPSLNNRNCDEPLDPKPSTSVESKEASLPPLSRATRRTTRKRKPLPSMILTSTPVKEVLEVKEREKDVKDQKKRAREVKLNSNSSKNERAVKRKKKEANPPSSSSPSFSVSVKEECLICGEFGKTETWLKCNNCSHWAHSECSGWSDLTKAYYCDFCK